MKYTIISVIAAILIIGGAFLFSGNQNNNVPGNSPVSGGNNVSIVGGKQIIEIRAKGGYSPRISAAKAGMPTVIRFTTQGTFDCSSYVRIPSLNVSKVLPQTGTTEIDLGTPQSGNLQGFCGMGMYPFEIDFN